jgi:hypothetical protein
MTATEYFLLSLDRSLLYGIFNVFPFLPNFYGCKSD